MFGHVGVLACRIRRAPVAQALAADEPRQKTIDRVAGWWRDQSAVSGDADDERGEQDGDGVFHWHWQLGRKIEL